MIGIPRAAKCFNASYPFSFPVFLAMLAAWLVGKAASWLVHSRLNYLKYWRHGQKLLFASFTRVTSVIWFSQMGNLQKEEELQELWLVPHAQGCLLSASWLKHVVPWFALKASSLWNSLSPWAFVVCAVPSLNAGSALHHLANLQRRWMMNPAALKEQRGGCSCHCETVIMASAATTEKTCSLSTLQIKQWCRSSFAPIHH